MQPILDKWTIVVVGQWNVHVFNPAWVSQNLFGSEELGIEINLENVPDRVRFRCGNVILIPTESRLIVGMTNVGDEALRDAETVTRRILDLLSHTPISACGINFGYREDNPPADLLSLFRFDDIDDVSDFGASIVRSEINRTLHYDQHVINLKHVLADGGVEVHINFHYEAAPASVAGELLQNRTQSTKELAEQLLEQVYNLTVEAEEQ
jgi:hypothetical protein